jgi:hypothetical protein
LLKIVLSSDSPADVRQLAAVEARKHVDAFWPKMDDGPKPEVRTALLEFALSNDAKLLRRATADIVVEIASLELSQEGDRLWAELPGLLFQGTKSKEARHREMSLHIIYQLMVDQPELFADDLLPILGVVAAAIQDQESIEARVNALLIFGEVAVLVDPEENEPAIKSFQSSVPRMITVLKESIDSGDEELAVKCFEVFHNTIELGSAFFQAHFKGLMEFILIVMTNKLVDQEIRLQAIFFLTQAVSCRKMKIQALKLGESIAIKALQVVVEIDEFDDEGEQNPARQALGLLDILASSLPPSQVVLPLMKYVGEFSSHAEPAVRRAGILGLGMCVEGAPDFFSTQLKELIPLVLRLLGDPEVIVRGAALQTVSRLAEELCDEIGALHETLIPAIIKNFDFAATSLGSQTGKDAEKSVQILLDCCVAIDSIMDGLEKDDAIKYQEELVPRLNKLLAQDHSKMKLCAVAAIGSIAEAAEDGFLPYFKDAMNSLGPYMNQKEDTEDLNIRRIVTDAMGRIAVAVGPAAFKDYVRPLMQASEEALKLEDEELRESSYILWSYMVKVYGEDFEPFLEGVLKGLFDCLDQEEESLTLDADSEDALEKIVARISANKKLSDKKLKDVDISELLTSKGAEIGTIDVEDDDDVESIGLGPATAISMEKEIAVGVMGDVLFYSKAKFLPYFKKTIESMVTLTNHPYHGVRQSAVDTLLRAYESLWQIETDKGMEKWQPGIPLKVAPTADLTQLGGVVMEATLAMWEDQDERYVSYFPSYSYPDDTLVYPAHSDASRLLRTNVLILFPLPYDLFLLVSPLTAKEMQSPASTASLQRSLRNADPPFSSKTALWQRCLRSFSAFSTRSTLARSRMKRMNPNKRWESLPSMTGWSSSRPWIASLPSQRPSDPTSWCSGRNARSRSSSTPRAPTRTSAPPRPERSRS